VRGEWLSPRALGWPARSATGRVQVARYLMFAVFAYSLDGVARASCVAVGSPPAFQFVPAC
jgi:hypothetical protein